MRSLSGVSCRLHDLRHILYTSCRERRCGVYYACLMGHMSRAILERYSHIRMAAKREAVAAITLRPIVEDSEMVPVKVPVAAQFDQIQ